MFETQLDEICLFPLQNKKNSFTFDDKKADEVNKSREALGSGPAGLLAPPPLPAPARSRALGPVTGRTSGPWSGIPRGFVFPAPSGPGFPYSPYLNL